MSIFTKFRYPFSTQQPGLDARVTTALQDNFRNAQNQLSAIDEAIDAMWASRAGNVCGHAGASAPAGALLCYGQAVSRTTYAILFAVIGTAFGSGDGVTTFNVPDLRGRVWAGLDNMGGTDAGRLNMANTLGTTGGDQNGTAYSVLPAGYSGGGAYRHSYDGYSAIASAMGGSISLIGVMGTTDGTGWSKTGGLYTEVYAIAYAISRMQPTMLGNYIIWTGERP